MVQAAEETGRLLVEAFHYRYHPLFERILDIVRSGSSGRSGTWRPGSRSPSRIATICATATKRRAVPRWTSAVTRCTGCARSPGTEPRVLSARAEQGARHVDVTMQAELAFPGGHDRAHADLHGRPREVLHVRCASRARTARSSSTNPLAPHNGHELALQRRRRRSRREGRRRQTTYRHQLLAFVNAVRTGKKLAHHGRGLDPQHAADRRRVSRRGPAGARQRCSERARSAPRTRWVPVAATATLPVCTSKRALVPAVPGLAQACAQRPRRR